MCTPFFLQVLPEILHHYSIPCYLCVKSIVLVENKVSNFGPRSIMLFLWLTFWPNSCLSFLSLWINSLLMIFSTGATVETVIFPIYSYLWHNGEKGGMHGIDIPKWCRDQCSCTCETVTAYSTNGDCFPWAIWEFPTWVLTQRGVAGQEATSKSFYGAQRIWLYPKNWREDVGGF